MVWGRQAQIWASLLWPCVEVPNSGPRRGRLAVVETASNIQLLWGVGQMETTTPQGSGGSLPWVKLRALGKGRHHFPASHPAWS